VLALLADGHSEKQVARDLGISPHTVHGHVKALHRRLGVSSRAELLAVCPLRLRWHDGPGGSATAAQPWGSR
jgi:DNA-binding CsgD family transcriptional regulator